MTLNRLNQKLLEQIVSCHESVGWSYRKCRRHGENGAVCFASTSSQLAIIHVHLLHTKILYLLLSGFCLLGLIYVLGGRLMISSRCSIKFFALFASISAIRSCQKKAYTNEKHEDKSPTQISSKLIMTALK